MKRIAIILIGLMMFCTFAVAHQNEIEHQNKGAKELKLYGGSKGEISIAQS